jgi:hypothetical protein
MASVAASAALMRTGYTGGQIRHSEIRSGNAATDQPARESAEDDD